MGEVPTTFLFELLAKWDKCHVTPASFLKESPQPQVAVEEDEGSSLAPQTSRVCLFVCFLGHIQRCSVVTRVSLLRNHACWVQGPYGMLGIKPGSALCKALPAVLLLCPHQGLFEWSKGKGESIVWDVFYNRI